MLDEVGKRHTAADVVFLLKSFGDYSKLSVRLMTARDVMTFLVVMNLSASILEAIAPLVKQDFGK